MPAPGSAPVTVIGLADDRFEVLAPEAQRALERAGAVAGDRRHLALWRSWPATSRRAAETLEIAGDPPATAAGVRRWVDRGVDVCVLAPGDPGFFGIVRTLLGALDRRSLAVLPAPSMVSVAFARLALPWDDALVVSAEGQSVADAVTAVRTARKAAVLTSPHVPPERLGAALVDAGVSMDLVAVCEHLGSADESVRELSLAQLAAGRFDPLAVVVLVGPGTLPLVGWAPGSGRAANWAGASGLVQRAGRMDGGDRMDGTDGAAASAELRAVALARLALPASGVLWDVGGGDASVAVDAALARPGLTVMAVEGRPGTASRISSDALSLGAAVHVVPGRAPEALAPLPAPDRAFIGNGDPTVLDAVLERLRPGGRVVVALAALDRAVVAAERLGNLIDVSVARGERHEGGWRLRAQDPQFVAWGPQ